MRSSWANKMTKAQIELQDAEVIRDEFHEGLMWEEFAKRIQQYEKLNDQ